MRMKGYITYLTLIFTFLLGSWEGYITLWRTGTPEPMEVFPYRVITLPPADQQALEEGIRVRNRQELTRLLEDFLS